MLYVVEIYVFFICSFVVFSHLCIFIYHIPFYFIFCFPSIICTFYCFMFFLHLSVSISWSFFFFFKSIFLILFSFFDFFVVFLWFFNLSILIHLFLAVLTWSHSFFLLVHFFYHCPFFSIFFFCFQLSWDFMGAHGSSLDFMDLHVMSCDVWVCFCFFCFVTKKWKVFPFFLCKKPNSTHHFPREKCGCYGVLTS